MIAYDCHVHSAFSTDSEENPENIVNQAQKLGLRGFCLTDHMDLYYPEQCIEEGGGDFTFDPGLYFERLEELKERCRFSCDILAGIEIGLRNEPELKDKCISEYTELTEKYPFDFVIGSTHCLANYDPYYGGYWDGKSAEEGFGEYWSAVAENIAGCSCFDTVGHLDYLVRYVAREAALVSLKNRKDKDDVTLTAEQLAEKNFYGKYLYRPSDYADITDEILRLIINNGKALEVNTAGLKYGLGFAHPKKEILMRYRELGGELITVGSDAHSAGEIAGNFNGVCDLLEELGYKYYFVYRNRKPVGKSLKNGL